MIARSRIISSSGSLRRTALDHHNRRPLLNGLSSHLSSLSQQARGDNVGGIVHSRDEDFSVNFQHHNDNPDYENKYFSASIDDSQFHPQHNNADVPAYPLSSTVPLPQQLSPLAPYTEKSKHSKKFPPTSLPSFIDPVSTYGTKTIPELLSSLIILRLCQIKPLVQNAERLIALSPWVLGETATDKAVKHTFFNHFCGGEDAAGIRPTVEGLKQNGIGSILDYAAESDHLEEEVPDDEPSSPFSNEVPTQPENQPARIYDYKSEELCEQHLKVFKSCIHAVRDATPEGFAAIKVTALGNPKLLERLSTAITEAKNLFSKFDEDGNGILTREEFSRGYRIFFNDAEDKLPSLLERLDPNGIGEIDYIEWSKLLTPVELRRIVKRCRSRGPLYSAAPSAEEVDLILAMHERAHSLAEEAFENNVRLLIDAEQTRYQPAIDNIVLELQQKFNAVERTDVPIIFNTYQAYLKDMPHRMIMDVKRSQRYNYHFGAKLVRGAYMVGERALAAEKGFPSPIHDTISETHTCYDQMVEYLLRYCASYDSCKLEAMVATHNQSSIEKTISLMNELNMSPDDSVVHFAQLYGMSDNLTYTLGKHQFRAYKYLPYGSVNEVIPYLVRRGQENSDVFGNAGVEMDLMKQELKRRIWMNGI